MNIQSRYPTTADDFLLWNEGREGKREFVRGRVVEMMINTSRNHARIAFNLLSALGRRLDLSEYEVGSADFGVRTPDGVRFPDVYVDRPGSDARGSDLVARAPVCVAEILSPSSYGRDFIDKVADYTSLPSLVHYIILSQDEPRVWLWSRQPHAAEWNAPMEIAGEEAVLPLVGLETEIPLAELYFGLRPRDA
jgi:Uma2 family endonuclease